MTRIVVATFYQFTDFHDFREWREPLLNVCNEQGIRGTILIAEEGINATIAGTREGIDRVLAFLKADDRFATMLHKESFTDTIPFDRMKVRLKKEIVTLGVPSVDPTRQVGTYVPARDWNDLISSPDVILIDTRNDFECDVGTFHGALNPHTESFGEFPEYVKQHLDPAAKPKVAMFCTGGIRCEKATSWMLSQGFEEVYHLEGGILKYLEDVPPEESMWEGECFVFDERVTLDHHLQRGSYRFCEECNQLIPADAETCPHCADTGS